MLRRLVRAVAAVSILLGLAMPATAFAGTDPFAGVDCNGQASNSTLCNSRNVQENPLTGPNGAITSAINIMSVIAGFVAIVFIIFGGIKYITAGGASDEISKAKHTIIFAIVGLIIIVISRAVIGFVIGQL